MVQRVLVEAGANVNMAKESGYTALHAAAKAGNDAGARSLLLSRANVDVAEKDGTTPLLLCKQYGQESTLRLLIHAGASTAQLHQEAEEHHVSGVLRPKRKSFLGVGDLELSPEKPQKGSTAIAGSAQEQLPLKAAASRSHSPSPLRASAVAQSLTPHRATPPRSESPLTQKPMLSVDKVSPKHAEMGGGEAQTPPTSLTKDMRTGRDTVRVRRHRGWVRLKEELDGIDDPAWLANHGASPFLTSSPARHSPAPRRAGPSRTGFKNT